MSAEGQEIRDERVEEPTATATTQEEGGDDEVRFCECILCHSTNPTKQDGLTEPPTEFRRKSKR